ncbi:unnamed protein product [Brassica oleracea]
MKMMVHVLFHFHSYYLLDLDFGKDSITRRYKIVWLYNIYPATLRQDKVFDLEEWRWRFVTTRPLDHHNIFSNQRLSFANGLVYWLTGR